MCGIYGITNYDPDFVKKFIDTCKHRGPDGSNVWHNDNITFGHNLLSINNVAMQMDVINERVKQGDMELWTVKGEMMPHPFHVHGVSFQIITHNGQPPAEADRGWKDTLVVTEEPTEILMRFDHLASQEFPYMYHCHIFEHEESGMMGQFTVTQ